ncbi:hypothetical protein ABKN59_011523 [Abortiporus biennis]
MLLRCYQVIRAPGTSWYPCFLADVPNRNPTMFRYNKDLIALSTAANEVRHAQQDPASGLTASYRSYQVLLVTSGHELLPEVHPAQFDMPKFHSPSRRVISSRMAIGNRVMSRIPVN